MHRRGREGEEGEARAAAAAASVRATGGVGEDGEEMRPALFFSIYLMDWLQSRSRITLRELHGKLVDANKERSKLIAVKFDQNNHSHTIQDRTVKEI